MNDKKWTDGPWQVINGFDVFGPLGGDSGDGVQCDDSDGWQVASCDPRPSFVDDKLVDLGYNVAKANAHLIAAAPELYEALECAMEWIDAVPSNTHLPAMPGFDRDWLDGVMAKARGGR